jgi:hypothetical protein
VGEQLASNCNGKRYPFNFVYIIVFVDTEGFYRHIPSTASSPPYIPKPSISDGMFAHCTDSFFGDGVRGGGDSFLAAQLSKPLGDERVKGSVPQDLYRVSTYVLSLVLFIIIIPYQIPLKAS